MSNVKWTENQEKAIRVRGKNVLVNAAAGSGKTAVLSARIVGRIAPENTDEAIRADRLLVVTFTKAAAAEMRGRIEKGLRAEYESAAREQNGARMRFVKTQEKRLMSAKICTIDAYCQSVVKEFFHIAGIDPAFSVLQAGELKSVHAEVFSALADRLLDENDESFLYLCRTCAGSGKEDEEIYALLERMYKFTSSMPYPEEFVRNAAKMYADPDGGLFKTVAQQNLAAARSAAEKLAAALEILPEDAKFAGARAILETELAFAQGLCDAEPKRLAELAQGAEFVQLRISEFDGKAQIQTLRGDAKELVRGIADTDCSEGLVRDCLYPQISALADIFSQYIGALWEYKKKYSVLEFSDIEQLCYRIIRENEAVRRSLRGRFDEILIDEYQDTNELQDSLFAMLSNGSNLFMVGDIKQSIYRFRNADVLVFGKKADSYGVQGENMKISLSDNFRSRGAVLDAVNDIFERIMSRELGGVEYDGAQRLNCGNKSYEDTGCDYRAECVVVAARGADDEDKPDGVRAEAEYIAARILQMKRDVFLVKDRVRVKNSDGGYDEVDGVRCVKNSDFAVLMSSHKNEAQVFAEVFEKYAIPLTSERRGFFRRPEIRVMMSILRVIENPERDVETVALMRSAAGGFTDDEIARIRSFERGKSFCGAVFSVYSKYLAKKDELSGAAKRLGEKCAALCRALTRWRDMARYLSAEQMVRALYEQTGILAFFGAAGDEEAVANLQLFCSRAVQAEKNGFCGVFKFLQYMTRLEKNDDDLSGAQTAHDDCVRLMTIHKSKGLEMPVVFVAGCGKKLNLKDDKPYMHNELGIAMDYINFEAGVKITSPAAQLVYSRIKSELKSEEVRKLYVAATRAKEKLIITASMNPDSADFAKFSGENSGGAPEDARRYIDWVAPVARASDNWIYTVADAAPEQAALSETAADGDFYYIENPDRIIGFKYPYAEKNVKSKASVSEFKKIERRADFAAELPSFMAGKSGGGARYGTAVHRILELLPTERGTDTAYIERLIGSLFEAGELDGTLKKSITPGKIAAFYSSDIGKRIARAEEVHRESEFEISADAGELYGEEELCGEQVLLQGVIDCWFEEEDGIVLVDYKTDNVNDIDEIHQKYDIQLALYARALEKITKKSVKDKIIYLFSRDIVIQC